MSIFHYYYYKTTLINLFMLVDKTALLLRSEVKKKTLHTALKIFSTGKPHPLKNDKFIKIKLFNDISR